MFRLNSNCSPTAGDATEDGVMLTVASVVVVAGPVCCVREANAKSPGATTKATFSISSPPLMSVRWIPPYTFVQ